MTRRALPWVMAAAVSITFQLAARSTGHRAAADRGLVHSIAYPIGSAVGAVVKAVAGL